MQSCWTYSHTLTIFPRDVVDFDTGRSAPYELLGMEINPEHSRDMWLGGMFYSRRFVVKLFNEIKFVGFTSIDNSEYVINNRNNNAY